jgi:hypothetical protein
LGAAVGFAAQYLNARQQRELEQRQMALEQQEAARQNAMLAIEMQRAKADEAESAARIKNYEMENAQNAADRAFESGLQLPKNWGSMTPQQQVAYLQVRQNAARKAGDKDVVNETQSQINSISLGDQRFANTQYTLQGRLPLAQAQTENAKNAFNHAMALLDARGKIALQAAYARGGGRAAGSSAYINALNALSRTQYSEQVRAALDEYNQQMQNYRASFDTNGNPTMAEPAAPNIQVSVPVYVPGPNGQPMVIHVPQSQPRTPAAQPRAQAAPPAQPQQGGNWFGDAIHNVEQFFGFGEKTRNIGGTIYYKHADGKWYTSP